MTIREILNRRIKLGILAGGVALALSLFGLSLDDLPDKHHWLAYFGLCSIFLSSLITHLVVRCPQCGTILHGYVRWYLTTTLQKASLAGSYDSCPSCHTELDGEYESS